MSGRPHALTYPKLRAIDKWYVHGTRMQKPSWKVMAHQMGVSLRTLKNAAWRKAAYTGIARKLNDVA